MHVSSEQAQRKTRRRVIAAFALLAVVMVINAVIFVNVITAPKSNDPFEASAVTNPPFTSLTYGIQTFLWWNKSVASLHLDWVRLMVFSHVKQIFSWQDLEPAQGTWEFSRADEIVNEVEAKGVKLVVRLSDAPEWAHPSIGSSTEGDFLDAPPEDNSHFADYCGAIATRYKGRIAAYQIWNEPNLAREWGGKTPNAADYVALLAVCSEAIRAADPAAILISAGLAPTGTYDAQVIPDDIYFQSMYDAGFQNYVDVAGVNAPGYNFPPEVSPDEAVAQGSQRFFTFRRVEDMREIMVKNGDAARQMAILEMGWTTDRVHPSYSWYAVTKDEQADYLVRAYQYAAERWRPWMGLMSTIYLADPSWTEDDEQYWWSVDVGSGSIGKSFIALANMAKYCGERVIPARDPGSPEAMGLVTVDPCP